jgi:murein DD-endopeptidase MepM/ murein hydrolase activator NlpD
VPLYARPRHAAPRRSARARAALVPAVLLATTGSALGGLAVSASAEEPAAALAASSPADAEMLLADRRAAVEQRSARASRERTISVLVQAEAERVAAEAAAAAEAQRLAEEAAAQQAAAEAAALAAAAPQYARPGDGRLTSGYGSRWGRLHAGIDLAAGTGSPIRAAAAGTVLSAGDEGAYGRCIRIQHADGSVTVYAHLSAFEVSGGQQVAAGQQIGREGNTGRSTGPHLHFEVRIGDQPVNPAAWLAERGVPL